MVDSIPSSANSLIDFAAQLADQRKAATSDGSTSSDNGSSDIARKKLVKLDAASLAAFGTLVPTIPGDEEIKRMSKLSDLMRLKGEKFKLEGEKGRLEGEKNKLEWERNNIDRLADRDRKHYEFLKKRAALSPERIQSVTGAEAKRVWELARQNAREGGHFAFPPPKEATYILMAEGFQYNIGGDGTITRRKEGVPTPEEHESIVAEINKIRTQGVGIDAERAKRYSEIDAEIKQFDNEIKQFDAESKKIDAEMKSLKAELGVTDDSWRNELKTRMGLSVTA
ncbi:hypothetical protein [Magnetospirillum fulvum]|uniref:Uncharacterized protein n=1 Tax=Magnetospirillum fulvum MGU-K5 TaxID=1316936 RepID=S9THU8_MAGFU|nr:hypothetical protein [Magnetospirillum fulvum]EPY01856.1 hypothetical protein K678_08781 [Magnetospirillum fulvum MGU-K5]